jgi:hypothetical protein
MCLSSGRCLVTVACFTQRSHYRVLSLLLAYDIRHRT